MKQIHLTLTLCLFMVVAKAQYVYTISADSVKLTNTCDSTELILMNHTQGIPGFLFNTGNGRTIFKHAVQKLSDSTYLIGADTLTVSTGFVRINPLGQQPGNFNVSGNSTVGGTFSIGSNDTIKGATYIPNALGLYAHNIQTTTYDTLASLSNTNYYRYANGALVIDSTGSPANYLSGGYNLLIYNTKNRDIEAFPQTAPMTIGGIKSTSIEMTNDAPIAGQEVQGNTPYTMLALDRVNYVNLFQMNGTAALKADSAGNVYLPKTTGAYGAGLTLLAMDTTTAGNDHVYKSYTVSSLPVALATADLTGQTAAITVASYAVPSGSNHTYSIGVYLTVSSVSGDSVAVQVSWTDETSASRTQSLISSGATTSKMGATGAYLFSPVELRAKAGTTISLQTTLPTSSGSIGYDVGGDITLKR